MTFFTLQSATHDFCYITICHSRLLLHYNLQIKTLLKSKEVHIEDVDPTDSSRPTAVIVASELGLVDVVKTLMKAKPRPADINAETRRGRRAIW